MQLFVIFLTAWGIDKYDRNIDHKLVQGKHYFVQDRHYLVQWFALPSDCKKSNLNRIKKKNKIINWFVFCIYEKSDC
jgi:uncharacterized protein YijF (DUF1287 family)